MPYVDRLDLTLFPFVAHYLVMRRIDPEIAVVGNGCSENVICPFLANCDGSIVLSPSVSLQKNVTRMMVTCPCFKLGLGCQLQFIFKNN
ncbi:unnamed protein product [Urochloa humidicola]